MKRLAPAILLVLMLSVPAERGFSALTVNLIYEDVLQSTGAGFDDPVLGAARRDTISAVMTYVTSQLDSSAYNATIDYRIDPSLNIGGMNFLASSGPFFFTSPDGFQNGLVFEHADTGSDPAAGVPDATATFDFGHAYHLGTDPNPGGLNDLFSVALHEFTHSMGFLSLLNSDGTGFNNDNPDVFSVFDSFLELGDGTLLFGAGGEFLGDPADLTSDNVFFNGDLATFVNGGMPVKIFAPGTFDDGSSISHIDGLLDVVMNPTLTIGTEERAWTALDQAVLQDLGWQFANPLQIPEPGSLVLLGLGLSGIAVHHRRRRRNSSVDEAA